MWFSHKTHRYSHFIPGNDNKNYTFDFVICWIFEPPGVIVEVGIFLWSQIVSECRVGLWSKNEHTDKRKKMWQRKTFRKKENPTTLLTPTLGKISGFLNLLFYFVLFFHLSEAGSKNILKKTELHVSDTGCGLTCVIESESHLNFQADPRLPQSHLIVKAEEKRGFYWIHFLM